MAKKTGPKSRLPQARIAFLFHAAECLSAQVESVGDPSKKQDSADVKHTNDIGGDPSMLHKHAVPAYLADQMFGVRQKGVGKVDKDLKRRICKRCKCFLIDGKTCSTAVENKSTKSSPWADVKVVSCLACGMQRRYPVGVKKPGSKGIEKPASKGLKKAASKRLKKAASKGIKKVASRGTAAEEIRSD
jgi:ribonuclease P protein subunit RPR2